MKPRRWLMRLLFGRQMPFPEWKSTRDNVLYELLVEAAAPGTGRMEKAMRECYGMWQLVSDHIRLNTFRHEFELYAACNVLLAARAPFLATDTYPGSRRVVANAVERKLNSMHARSGHSNGLVSLRYDEYCSKNLLSDPDAPDLFQAQCTIFLKHCAVDTPQPFFTPALIVSGSFFSRMASDCIKHCSERIPDDA